VPRPPNWGWQEDGRRDQIRAGDVQIQRREAKHGYSFLKLERKAEGGMEKIGQRMVIDFGVTVATAGWSYWWGSFFETA